MFESKTKIKCWQSKQQSDTVGMFRRIGKCFLYWVLAFYYFQQSCLDKVNFVTKQ